MKTTALALLSLLCLTVAGLAHAGDVTLADTACTNYVCFNPAPGVAYVGTDASYSTAIAMVGGVLYTGATTSVSGDAITAELHSADGRQIVLTAAFRKWVTVTNAGRAHYRITHLELLGGSITV